MYIRFQIVNKICIVSAVMNHLLAMLPVKTQKLLSYVVTEIFDLLERNIGKKYWIWYENEPSWNKIKFYTWLGDVFLTKKHQNGTYTKIFT